MPIRDADVDLSPFASDLPFSATNLLGEHTLDIEGTGFKGLAVRLNVSFNHGFSLGKPTLTTVIHAASSTPVASSDPIVYQSEALVGLSDAGALSGSHERIYPFHTKYRYVRAEFQLGGAASDSPSWSVVEAFLVENVQETWDRKGNYH